MSPDGFTVRPIDIEGAARLGVRHATADHPRELLPSTIAACSGVVTFPRTRPVTTWLAETGHRPPGRGPVVVPPPVRGGSGQRVTVGGPSRRRPTTVRAVAARMRGPRGPPGRCACWSASDSRGGTAGDAHPMPIHRHEEQNPLELTRAAPLGQVTIFSFEGAESGHRRTEQFARTGEFGPDLPY
jgi:hypothetical protein